MDECTAATGPSWSVDTRLRKRLARVQHAGNTKLGHSVGWHMHLLARTPISEALLFVEALSLVGLTRLALAWLHFADIEKRLNRLQPYPPQRGANSPSVDQVVWAVKVSSRVVPGATCLTQALAAGALLRRHGHAAKLQISVARDSAGVLAAHAWVEAEGRAVIGGRSEATSADEVRG